MCFRNFRKWVPTSRPFPNCPKSLFVSSVGTEASFAEALGGFAALGLRPAAFGCGGRPGDGTTGSRDVAAGALEVTLHGSIMV